MATPSKAQFLAEVHTLLKKRYKSAPGPAKLSILESVVYGICHDGSTREQADGALSRFKDGYFDWNELRVSSVEEIQSVLAGLPDAEPRAYRIRRFLRQVFEKMIAAGVAGPTFGFNVEVLAKKPQKEALKALDEYEALGSDFVQASVVRLALGGHAIGVDAPLRRVLERLGVDPAGLPDAELRGMLERAVPKNRGGEFLDLMEDLAADVCVEGEPDCANCELRKVCPTGQARLAESAAATKAAAKAAAKLAKAAATPAAQAPAAKPEPKAADSKRKRDRSK